MVIAKQSSASGVADIAVVVMISVLAFLGELAAADYLPWGDEARGVLAVLAGAAAAAAVTLLRGGSLADLGFRAPGRWATVPLWALGILVVFVAAQNVVPLLLAPFFDLPQPDMSRYDVIRGNPAAALSFAVVLPLTAAVPEEILYRGFLIGRFTNLFGGGRAAAVFAVLAQALVFGAVHFQWGPGGILATSVMGAVWGFAYLLCGRNLWIVILAHSLAHIALVAQLYSLPPP
jgi:membrane protease YdiL (CAAX protease family)